MNKTSPKKIMEIIFIFVLPLLLVIGNGTFFKSNEITNVTEEVVLEANTSFFEYDSPLVEEGPIKKVLEIPFNLLGVDYSYMTSALIDYTTLWFIMFITWHLLYLFFDTIMHKVLLRKD